MTNPVPYTPSPLALLLKAANDQDLSYRLCFGLDDARSVRRAYLRVAPFDNTIDVSPPPGVSKHVYLVTIQPNDGKPPHEIETDDPQEALQFAAYDPADFVPYAPTGHDHD